MTRERLYAAGRSVLLPVGGFFSGWLTYRVVEDKGLIDERYLRRIHAANLKAQLYMQQHILPTAFCEKYCYQEEFLKTMIERLSTDAGDDADERWTFEEVLKQCDVPEQMAWLEEHVSYDIPYFYIADLFNSWSNLHRYFFIAGEEKHRAGDEEAPRRGVGDEFASEVLCNGVVTKTMNGVFPYDVAVRTLCVLARGSNVNAQVLSKLISPGDILERYEAYVEDLGQRGKLSGDAIPVDEVAAATLELLRALNAASVHQRWFPLWGRASTGPYPVAALLDRDRWCRCFGGLPAGVAGICTDSTLVLADILSERFNCGGEAEAAATGGEAALGR
ncbi:hypothetical protein DQ04_06241040 [Trypanosoma grayi]|uniref:hypothetical protein n=1 Tax=Trypanosoma grayi TaxID=71804 RepID=UPI0004F44C61|nr:hypothetical protein DQ04_06241040 [Trypanosoma grayi]KEG08893.1 hypothetical protein DQ04_06241040 [Trypanosoma grayi]